MMPANYRYTMALKGKGMCKTTISPGSPKIRARNGQAGICEGKMLLISDSMLLPYAILLGLGVGRNTKARRYCHVHFSVSTCVA